MRPLLILLVCCAGFYATAADQSGAELHKKPVKAAIVPTQKDNPYVGNVRVTYEDGTSDLWTKNGDCSDVHVAADGTVGWVVSYNLDIPDHPRATQSCLILFRKGRIIARIVTGRPVIAAWAFLESGKQVVLLTTYYHGPREAYELFDTATGNQLNELPENEKNLPDWAKALDSSLHP